MGDRAAKTALFDEFARVGKALASGRRIELLDVLANGERTVDARVGKALASGRRIELLDVLANGERTVDALAGEVGLSVANTSQHLQVLRQAGCSP
jgi:predicted ArsR family transcriptional regulator